MRLHLKPVFPTLLLLAAAAATCPAPAQTPTQAPAQPSTLPDAPSHTLATEPPEYFSSSATAEDRNSPELAALLSYSLFPPGYPQQDAAAQKAKDSDPHKKTNVLIGPDTDENGNPIPLNRRQPKRILGILPNYRTVAAGAAVHPPGWKYNFHVATRQAFDPSSFLFLGLTSISAEGLNSHPVLGKGVHGFYSYTWRGLIDKTDGTYLSAFVLASALREDTRYYPLGDGHSVLTRSLYVISRQGVARDYTGHQVFNMAGLGGKVLTQYISRFYYPTGATDLSVLATKFAYSAMRDIGFSSIREFYPDIAAHYIRKHREKMARLQQSQP